MNVLYAGIIFYLFIITLGATQGLRDKWLKEKQKNKESL